jgi:DNA topoisomerase-1
LLPKDLGNIKREEVQVSNRYGPHCHGAAFCLSKGENLDIDFERAKELIDEKAIADAPVAFYKGEFRKVLAVFPL